MDKEEKKQEPTSNNKEEKKQQPISNKEKKQEPMDNKEQDNKEQDNKEQELEKKELEKKEQDKKEQNKKPGRSPFPPPPGGKKVNDLSDIAEYFELRQSEKQHLMLDAYFRKDRTSSHGISCKVVADTGNQSNAIVVDPIIPYVLKLEPFQVMQHFGVGGASQQVYFNAFVRVADSSGMRRQASLDLFISCNWQHFRQIQRDRPDSKKYVSKMIGILTFDFLAAHRSTILLGPTEKENMVVFKEKQ